MLHTLEEDWQGRVAHCPFAASIAFDAQGLRLGFGTLLFAFEEEGPHTITLDRHAGHDRLVALLAVAGNGALAKDCMLHVGAALADWRRGDKALAAIRLAFARLPRLADGDAAYRLFLAEKVLDGGLAPDALLGELGYASAIDPLLKFPGQARVPKGSGRPSGRFAGDQSAKGRTQAARKRLRRPSCRSSTTRGTSTRTRQSPTCSIRRTSSKASAKAT